MEPVERLHQRVQGAGANSPVQGDGEAGGLSAVGPAFVIPNRNVDVRFRLTPSLTVLGITRQEVEPRIGQSTGKCHERHSGEIP